MISILQIVPNDHFKLNYLDKRSKLGVEKLSTNFLVVKIVPLHSFNDFASLKQFEVFGKKFSWNTITQLFVVDMQCFILAPVDMILHITGDTFGDRSKNQRHRNNTTDSQKKFRTYKSGIDTLSLEALNNSIYLRILHFRFQQQFYSVFLVNVF